MKIEHIKLQNVIRKDADDGESPETHSSPNRRAFNSVYCRADDDDFIDIRSLHCLKQYFVLSWYRITDKRTIYTENRGPGMRITFLNDSNSCFISVIRIAYREPS